MVGCMSIIGIIILLIILGAIVGNDKNQSNKKEEKTAELVIDANQFSRISSSELIEILGEPEKVEDYTWKIPKTNESIVGKLYIYDRNKYEFILFDDRVVRLNVYSGQFMGNDDSKMKFESEDDIFAMFGIEPNKRFRKVADTNYALRYTPVSDKVAEVWVQEINGNEFDIAKITYNLNYFE